MSTVFLGALNYRVYKKSLHRILLKFNHILWRAEYIIPNIDFSTLMLYVTDSGIVKSEIISVDGAIFLISCLSEKMEIPF